MAITNNDVEKLKEVFATKEDLKQSEDRVVTRLDKIIREQEKAREDRVFAKAKDDKQDQRLDRLEAKVGIA
jgi:hypothetical protein